MTTSLREIQRAMVAQIASKDGAGIYRKLVRRGLADVLRVQLTRTAAHLGARWDRDVARFLDETLPRSHYLRDTGFAFVAFASPGWDGDPEVPPYIGDLARHELLAFEVANAPDDGPLPDDRGLALDRRVALSASVRVARYRYAVHLLPEEDPPADAPSPPEAPALQPTVVCVYRDADFELRTLALTPSAAHILERLLAGATLGEAVSGAAAACGVALDPPFLQGAARLLEDLTERGAVRGLM